MEPGATVPFDTLHRLSADWYGGRLDLDWQRPTPERAEAIFASHGLVGDFWSLR